MKNLLPLLLILCSCQKSDVLPIKKDLQLSEFAIMLTKEKYYSITRYTDPEGQMIFMPDANKFDQHVFNSENPNEQFNGRIYNPATSMVCFYHWKAYGSPDGKISFEWVDFDRTLVTYTLKDYNEFEKYFILSYPDGRLLTFQQINL